MGSFQKRLIIPQLSSVRLCKEDLTVTKVNLSFSADVNQKPFSRSVKDFGNIIIIIKKIRYEDGKYLPQEGPPWRMQELTEVFIWIEVDRKKNHNGRQKSLGVLSDWAIDWFPLHDYEQENTRKI